VKAPILVVEDEEAIRSGLCDVLRYHGYEPTAAESGEEGLRCALDGEHALVLLDVMLPGLSGFDVCRALRAQRPQQGILLLTARGAGEHVVPGFPCGADDYVPKPFSIAELLVRIEALLRRPSGQTRGGADAFVFSGWRVAPATLTATRDGATCALSRREVDMLSLFYRERGRIVSRRTLLVEVWGMAHVDTIQTRTVDMHIVKLRKKLGAADAGPIETVRGEGYRFSG